MTAAPALLDVSDRESVTMISDLHLTTATPALSNLFETFIRDHVLTRRDTHLFLLGDVFEYWIGDDAASALGHDLDLDTIARVSDAGIPVSFVHGNRDFLVGETFAKRTGARILDPITVVQLPCTRAVICHGDELCTDDVDHQEFRRMVRNPAWQHEFLRASISERQALASEARETSKAHAATKTMDIMDVNEAAVDALLAEHNVDVMIHGHTHRPGLHGAAAGGSTRIVLGDWQDSASWLHITAETITLEAGSGRPGGTLSL